MLIDVWLIRHGSTKGNISGAYIGSTDEPLSNEGIKQLHALKLSGKLPPVKKVYASDLIRCVQSAKILFPLREPVLVPGLRECDFGLFEGKNHDKLWDDPNYQAWYASGGIIPFPNGEDPALFKKRCQLAFIQICEGLEEPAPIAVVCHGGTIMSILAHFSHPYHDFYHWQVKNSDGYSFKYDTERGLAMDIQKISKFEMGK